MFPPYNQYQYINLTKLYNPIVGRNIQYKYMYTGAQFAGARVDTPKFTRAQIAGQQKVRGPICQVWDEESDLVGPNLVSTICIAPLGKRIGALGLFSAPPIGCQWTSNPIILSIVPLFQRQNCQIYILGEKASLPKKALWRVIEGGGDGGVGSLSRPDMRADVKLIRK